jgi:preprotein translocase subunit SecA
MTVARQAGEFEEQVKGLNDEQLKAKTDEFKDALKQGKEAKDILPEAFAVVREAARRTVNMRHFDVQLVGGNVLYDGKIAEMATGEGKTLVATLAAYLVHLTGRHVHIVTVNDYLAKRDAEWMGPIYTALGLSVGAIQADMDTAGEERKNQYGCDITYGTNNEFGFDYLRDNMKLSLEHMVQGELQYAIVDEVDSILIDEARTPLIISGPAFDDTTRYKKADDVARKLIAMQAGYDRIKKQTDSAEKSLANARGELSESKKAKDDNRIEKAQAAIEKLEAEIADAQSKLTGATQYYEVEYDRKAVHLTHEGISAAQEAAGVGSFFTGSNMEWPHLLEQSLRAHIVFEKERDYVVMEGKVVIVDEFTGRLMHGRQWSDGLHQAVEAKEAVQVKEETQTLATITLQNFFKLYGQIAGMTGTAVTEGEEFMKIYKLDVVVIPTNAPCIRDDWDDEIYKIANEKFNAIIDEINAISGAGRPVLVGTVSVEKNEALSAALDKKFGLEHEVLNAKNHQREAQIVAKAGQQHEGRDGKMHGNITIATNMAGRGTDIKLGPGVLWEIVKEEVDPADNRITIYTLKQRESGNEITFKSNDPLANVFQITKGQKWVGGLHVLGTERHEARRIDNQLRGRCGRQGDPGSSQFFLSFDDELMRVFAPEWTVKALSWIGWQEGEPIYHKRISKGIEKAQKKVEERNFEIRKSLLEYDEVMDYQRKIFYSRRRKILTGVGLKEIIDEMTENAIAKSCRTILDDDYPVKCVVEWAAANFGGEIKSSDVRGLALDEIEQAIKQQAKNSAGNDISLSLGEYIEDYEDKSTWDASGLSKWAMSAFNVSLSPGKIKDLNPEQLEEQLTAAACAQIDKKDCSPLAEFLKPDFALRRLAEWTRVKFDIKLDIDELAGQKPEQIESLFREKTKAKYRRREIEYPVEFAMNMVYGPQGANVYGFETLADWANRKYNAGFTVDGLQQLKPQALQKQLLELSEAHNDGRLLEEIDNSLVHLDTSQAAQWASQRFGTTLTVEQLGGPGEPEKRKEAILRAGREFLRKEISDLEKYVLIQVYDGAWKDHLYNMDHLKDSIWMRSWAEKDPKTEYKREGYRMFNEMLENVESRVTDIIFKVHLEAGARARSVWHVSQTVHDQVGQFALAERQRAAAQAPQGEVKVKQIKLDGPKVGRNDPCPCGSGKKYKKCHGKSA